MGKKDRDGPIRVSREQVRANAKKGDRGPSFFKLPRKVREFSPDKPGKYKIDVVPYVTTDKNHPDDLKKGTLWYKRAFVVHPGVGPANHQYVCPISIGKPCPIHKERDRLHKKGGADEDTLKDLNGKKWIMFNILDPDDEDRIALFAYSAGKFWEFKGGGLKKEIEEGDAKNLGFFDVTDGRTIMMRFSEESFKGRKFLQLSRVDFEDRKDMDQDEILGKTVNLDECLNVLEYDDLKDLFLQTSDKDDEDDEEKKAAKKGDDDDDDEKPSKKGGKSGKSSKKDDEDDDDDDSKKKDDEDDD